MAVLIGLPAASSRTGRSSSPSASGAAGGSRAASSNTSRPFIPRPPFARGDADLQLDLQDAQEQDAQMGDRLTHIVRRASGRQPDVQVANPEIAPNTLTNVIPELVSGTSG